MTSSQFTAVKSAGLKVVAEWKEIKMRCRRAFKTEAVRVAEVARGRKAGACRPHVVLEPVLQQPGPLQTTPLPQVMETLSLMEQEPRQELVSAETYVVDGEST